MAAAKKTAPAAPKAATTKASTSTKSTKKAAEPKWVTTNDGVKIGHVPE